MVVEGLLPVADECHCALAPVYAARSSLQICEHLEHAPARDCKAESILSGHSLAVLVLSMDLSGGEGVSTIFQQLVGGVCTL